MKYFKFYLGLFWLFSLLIGCNQDVFINDFRTDISEVQLESDDDELILKFKNGDWELDGILSHSLKGYINSVYFQLYNEEGLATEKHKAISLYTLGRLELRHSLVELDIERQTSNELKIHVKENLLPDCKLELIFRHKEVYELYQTITIQIASARYKVKDISYRLNSFGVQEREERRNLITILHNSNSPNTYTVYPWSDEVKKVQFMELRHEPDSSIMLEMFNPYYLLDEPFEVIIPTRSANGFGFELKNDKALFNGELQYFTLPNAEQKQEIEITKTGTSVIMKHVKYKATFHGCNICLQNIKTGKERIFQGSLYQELPDQISINTKMRTNSR